MQSTSQAEKKLYFILISQLVHKLKFCMLLVPDFVIAAALTF